MGKATVVPTEMWAFALPLWAYMYVLVGFCPMASVLWAFVLWTFVRIPFLPRDASAERARL